MFCGVSHCLKDCQPYLIYHLSHVLCYLMCYLSSILFCYMKIVFTPYLLLAVKYFLYYMFLSLNIFSCYPLLLLAYLVLPVLLPQKFSHTIHCTTCEILFHVAWCYLRNILILLAITCQIFSNVTCCIMCQIFNATCSITCPIFPQITSHIFPPVNCSYIQFILSDYMMYLLLAI